MKKSKIFTGAVTIFLSTQGFITTVQDVFAQTEKVNEQPKAFISIEFTKEEAESYAKSIDEAMDLAKEEMEQELAQETDKDKRKYLEEDIINLANDENASSLFEPGENGKVELSIPHVNGEIEVDGNIYETDIEGNIEMSNKAWEKLEVGEVSDITFESDGDAISTEKSKIRVDAEEKEVKFVKSFEEFAEGVQDMSEKMASGEGQGIQLYSEVKPGQDSKTGESKKMGSGVGASVIFYRDNIVGCNKHDKNLKSINSLDFALQNSDCSRAVKQGLKWLKDQRKYASYVLSFSCVGEALTVKAYKNNLYCNGKKKSGGHVNCSWFYGISHTERFHTHY